MFGDEEARIIEPALAAVRSRGIAAEGPFGCDTMLGREGYDAYIVMFHHQGHIAAKLLARNRTAGLTIGTPVLFSSVAHGSALDIAGQGRRIPARRDGERRDAGDISDGGSRSPEAQGGEVLRARVRNVCRRCPEIENYLGSEIASRIRRVLAKPVTVLGRYTQALPNNWKLYVENVRDSYHASLLHVFFTTFEINRLSQSGGIIVDESGGNHVSYSKLDTKAGAEYDDLRSKLEDFRLADPSMLRTVDEFGDGVTLQILSVFPSFVLQQVQNSLAVRQVVPRSTTATDLAWTYLGFADDDDRLRTLRLKQANLVGPAGYISMEDGAVGGFVQRGIAGAPHARAVVEMGGHGVESQDTRATETSVRGFWKSYRQLMDL